MNYARIKACLGNKVHFWFMPDWETKLTRLGNDSLWKDTFRDFQAAQARLANLQIERELLKLMQSMQIHGLALEQEAIWL